MRNPLNEFLVVNLLSESAKRACLADDRRHPLAWNDALQRQMLPLLLALEDHIENLFRSLAAPPGRSEMTTRDPRNDRLASCGAAPNGIAI